MNDTHQLSAINGGTVIRSIFTHATDAPQELLEVCTNGVVSGAGVYYVP